MHRSLDWQAHLGCMAEWWAIGTAWQSQEGNDMIEKEMVGRGLSGVFLLGTVDTGAATFSVRGRLGHCGVLSSICRPYPLDARSSSNSDNLR